jgi:hypothetical protein
MTVDEVRDVIRKGVHRYFHVDSDGWIGHGTTAEDCYQCARSVEAATEAVVDHFKLGEEICRAVED